MPVKHLFVVGAGRMGAGIAQLAAQRGIQVTLMDVTEDLVRAGVERTAKSLQGRVDKGKLPAEEREAALSRISATTRLSDASPCDFVLEAIVEDIGVKRKVFGELDEAVVDSLDPKIKETIQAVNHIHDDTTRQVRLVERYGL